MRWIKASERATMKMVGGIAKSHHSYLHLRLREKFGHANKCESETCSHKNPKRFEWALRKGHQYSSNPVDYIQLCCSCHRKYDFNEDIRQKLKAKKRGENNNRSKMKNDDVLKILECVTSGMENKSIAKMFNIDPSTVSDIKRGKRWASLTGIKNQKYE